MDKKKPEALTFQELILRLQSFWAERGCILQQPYDVEVGAGTMAPETFLRVLGPKPYKVAYVQPSRRPAEELQFSVYNFEAADVKSAWEHLRLYEAECESVLKHAAKQGADADSRDIARLPILAAFDLCLKCSHLFNILDARGAISVTERV